MYCIWLTFDSSDLSEIISKLARKYNGPVFQPHCTLIGKTDISLPRMKSAIINLMNNFKPIEVHPGKIGYTDNIWRSLYIELKEKKMLTKWHEHICDLLSINFDNDYLPHISLMYNTVSEKEKIKIGETLQLKSVYEIHSIQVIDCGEKVEDWRTVLKLTIDFAKATSIKIDN